MRNSWIITCSLWDSPCSKIGVWIIRIGSFDSMYVMYITLLAFVPYQGLEVLWRLPLSGNMAHVMHVRTKWIRCSEAEWKLGEIPNVMWESYTIHQCDMFNNVSYLVLTSICKSTLMINNFTNNYHLTTLGVQVCLLISCHEYVQYCHEVHAYGTQWSTSWLKCTQNDTSH